MALFTWTGNPFVDTGLAVAVVRADKKSPEEMTMDDFKKVIGDGKWLTEANERLNAYTSIFLNGFLNRSVKPKDRPAQGKKYQKIILALLGDFEQSASLTTDSTNCCECTGIFPSANRTIAKLTQQFRQEGILTKQQRLDIGRNAFPLIGSLTNDAGALPAASREPQISAFALLCAQLASLASVMWKGNLAFFQYTAPNLVIPHVQQVYKETISKLDLINTKQIEASIEAAGTGKGAQTIALILLNELKNLKDTLEIEELPEYVALNIWLMNNRKTGDCQIIEIPNAALAFLWQASGTFSEEIKGILKKDKSSSILDCIEEQKEYLPLYPRTNSKPIPMDLIKKAKKLLSSEKSSRIESIENKEENEFNGLTQATIVSKKKMKNELPSPKSKKEDKKTILQLLENELKQNKNVELKELIKQIKEATSRPASKELFALYQTNVLRHPMAALATAEWIAYNLKERLKGKKEAKQLELFVKHLGDAKDDKKCRATMRQFFADFAEDGILTYEQYLALFPIVGRKPMRVDNFGWKYIWFYLNYGHLNSNPPQCFEENAMAFDHYFRQAIKEFAKDVFAWYIEKHGEAKFKRLVLDGFRNNKIKDQNLQQWFCNLAELPGKERYTNEAWDDLCRSEDGANRTYELRFQLRLELANLYRQYITK